MLVNRIYEWAKVQPDKIAFIYNDRLISYRAFACRIDAARAFFQPLNLPSGAIALLIVPDSSESWVYSLALRSLGLTTICASSQTTGLGNQERSVACIVTTRELLAKNPNPAGIPANVRLIVIPERRNDDSDTRNPPLPPSGTPPFGGHILLTSGTTGSYKKVLLPGVHEDERNAVRARTNWIDHNSVFNCADFPIWAGAGFKDPSALWHVGATVIVDGRLGRLQRLFDYKPTRIFLTPAHLNVALDRVKRAQADVESGACRLSISGGQPSVRALRRTLQTITRNIVVNWSATELIAFPMTSQVHEMDDMIWLKTHDKRVVEIVDESDAPCPIGTEGVLRIRLTDIEQDGYLDDAEATERHFRDGYFYPGDLAVRRADGRIRILGRANDVLNIRGQKVAVGPLEQEVQEALAVDNVCLFGAVNDEGVDELIIAVEADRSPPDAVMKSVVTKFKRFERVRFAIVKQFPRTEGGMRKVNRTALRKLVLKKV